MITKEKNRTKIICTVITAVLAAVTGGSVLRLYNVQNVTQTVNGNVIQILGETGSNISANMDLTDSTEELISEYKKVIDENSQYQTNQTTLQGQVQSLQSEDVVRDEHIRPISVSVNGGNVLMIKVIRTNSRYDSHAYICDTTLSVLQ